MEFSIRVLQRELLAIRQGYEQLVNRHSNKNKSIDANKAMNEMKDHMIELESTINLLQII